MLFSCITPVDLQYATMTPYLFCYLDSHSFLVENARHWYNSTSFLVSRILVLHYPGHRQRIFHVEKPHWCSYLF